MQRETAEKVIRTIEKGVAVSAGATLGFIGGNVTGAVLGGTLAGKLTEMKRKGSYSQGGSRNTTTGSAPNKRRRISKGRRVGRKKVLSRKGKKQLVRTARRKLKSMIKKEIMCTQSKGAYHKGYVGEYRVHNILPNAQVVTRSMTRGLNNGTPYTATAFAFTPFNLKRLLDAVSVLYNGKSKAINYEATVDNFPDQGKGLQVDFTYCSYTMRLSNQSKVPMDVVLYKATSKMNHSQTFIDAWSNSINSQPWRAGAPAITVVNMTPGVGDAEMRRHWTWKPIKFQLLPGQTKFFSAKWKGCLDFSKYMSSGTLQEYGKNISEEWTFVFKPSFSIRGNRTTNSLIMGHYGIDGPDADDAALKAIVFEVKEVYNCLQPPEADDTYEGNAVVNLMDYPAPLSGEQTWNVGDRWYRDTRNPVAAAQ